MTAERLAAKRRYMIRFLSAMAVYSVLIIIAGRTIRHVDPTWAKVMLALLPIVPIGVALSELLRFVASLDELQRRVQFEAVATAGVLTCMLTFAWGMLEMAGFPKLPIVLVTPLFSAAYGFGVWRATRKYE
jgi:hypothetical protein